MMGRPAKGILIGLALWASVMLVVMLVLIPNATHIVDCLPELFTAWYPGQIQTMQELAIVSVIGGMLGLNGLLMLPFVAVAIARKLSQ